MLAPIEGFNKQPLVSLEEATAPLQKIVPRIDKYVYSVKTRVKERSGNPADGLSVDESASIGLYTIEWTPYTESLYYILNSTLRTEDRQRLKPWFLYLKLILTALSRLPSVSSTVYRGVKSEIDGDMHEKYKVGKDIIWWGFSSCSKKRSISEKDQFIGEDGKGTLFILECIKGKDVSKHSFYGKEKEILLLPSTTLRVINRDYQENGPQIIHLKEIKPSHILLESVSSEDEIEALKQIPVSSQPKPPLKPPMVVRDDRYYNAKLSEYIARCKPRSEVYLIGRHFNENDMEIVVQQLMIEKQCRELFLRESGITSQGAIIIAQALFDNTTLERLFMSYNNIGDKGAEAIAESLTKNVTLKHLCLGYNGITDEGVINLANALETNKTLTDLWLPSNKITDRGLKRLAEVLTNKNKTLQVLSLEWNKFSSDSTVDILLGMLHNNKTLTSLNLNSCKLSRSAITQLKTAAKSKKNFELAIH
jgi:hypothetical protein